MSSTNVHDTVPDVGIGCAVGIIVALSLAEDPPAATTNWVVAVFVVPPLSGAETTTLCGPSVNAVTGV